MVARIRVYAQGQTEGQAAAVAITEQGEQPLKAILVMPQDMGTAAVREVVPRLAAAAAQGELEREELVWEVWEGPTV